MDAWSEASALISTSEPGKSRRNTFGKLEKTGKLRQNIDTCTVNSQILLYLAARYSVYNTRVEIGLALLTLKYLKLEVELNVRFKLPLNLSNCH